MNQKIIEGYGCESIWINSKVEYMPSQTSREPTYIMYPEYKYNLVVQFDEGIKIVVDKENNVKQINFDFSSGYTFHDSIVPRKTLLSDLKDHHWSYEHMYPGLISSEFYKGVGFALDINMPNYWEHRFECTSIKELIELNDCNIGEIIIFSNLIDQNHPFEMYEAFIWNNGVSQLRKL